MKIWVIYLVDIMRLVRNIYQSHDSDDIETADIEENAYEKFFQG